MSELFAAVRKYTVIVPRAKLALYYQNDYESFYKVL